jgi:PleD family two-component response regulator
LLDLIEKEYDKQIKNNRDFIYKIEKINLILEEQVENLESYTYKETEKRKRIEQVGEVLERLLLACHEWNKNEIDKINELKKNEQLLLEKYDKEIALQEAELERLCSALTKQLYNLTENIVRNVENGKSRVHASIDQLTAIAKRKTPPVISPTITEKNEQIVNTFNKTKPVTDITGVNTRILVADEDQSVGSLIGAVMEREGYEVNTFSDGKAILDYIEKHPPCAIVIIGYILPLVNGINVVRKIRETPNWEEVPIIVISYNSSEQEMNEAFVAGASDYITKPFSTMELVARAKRFIEDKKSK